jgi:putative transposase
MAQSLSKMYIHIIFQKKYNSPILLSETKNELFAYMGSIIKKNESIPILINGVEDHVHVLCVMSKNLTLSKLVEEIKRNSSRWIKTKGKHYKNFSWQGGYGGFSVSPSLHEKTRKYIQNQEAHHQKMNFKEEYILFLKEYGIEYDEKYLWTD